ncbi:MAG: TfoX/Sxy family protein [Gammaproteobacteria bacterium]
MSSSQGTVDFIIDQIAGIGNLRTRKMFGEYAIYLNEKVVAFVCDDQLFVKPTAKGKNFIKDYVEDYPYPGAKPHLLISGDLWENQEWLSQLFKITELALP